MTAIALDACYVFGIVRDDARTSSVIDDLGAAHEDAAGLHAIRLVGQDGIAAVVGSLPADRALGQAKDLRTHDRVLAAVVEAGGPVLPLRFGAVLSDESAVVDELLRPHEDRFTAGLEQLRGRVQYTVRARYEQEPVLREIVATHPEIAALRQSGDTTDMATQMRMGQLIVGALEQLRPADAAGLLADLEPTVVSLRSHEPATADEVVHLAALVDTRASERFEQAVEDCGRRSAGRLRIRLVGPVAAYDFVPEP